MVKQRHKILIILFIASSIFGYIYYQNPRKSSVYLPSNYQIYSKFPLDHTTYSSVKPELNNLNYQPVELWNGRLILPTLSQVGKNKFVFFEVENAPQKYLNLVGQTVKLEWVNSQNIKGYFNTVTRDVEFTKATVDSQNAGNLHPERLNRRHQVNPLQSLAGARPNDDVFVKLEEPINVSENGKTYTLKIDREPIQVTGKQYALVTILRQNKLGQDKFLVRHFEP
ncbi:hypothetical protein [Merismopedia glauca]|uniref:hypothetical protein n=1 Tax=Merismopedia glauca TaxID=292586 RepID=UPI0011B23A0C|nr:hypothetical protein [Merismopedia glauca]